MIRAALLTLAIVAAAASGPAFAGGSSQTISIDDGPGHELVIIRGAGGRFDGSYGQREVLAYTDASGVPVRVYADHPVSREEVQTRLRQAEREQLSAHREAAQARIEADQARREAARDQAEAEREAAHDRAEAQRETAQAQREAAQARYEAARDAAEARREAERAEAQGADVPD